MNRIVNVAVPTAVAKNKSATFNLTVYCSRRGFVRRIKRVYFKAARRRVKLVFSDADTTQARL